MLVTKKIAYGFVQCSEFNEPLYQEVVGFLYECRDFEQQFHLNERYYETSLTQIVFEVTESGGSSRLSVLLDTYILLLASVVHMDRRGLLCPCGQSAPQECLP
jgi:hypothetical protein